MARVEVPDTDTSHTGQSMIDRIDPGGWLVVPAHTERNPDSSTNVRFGPVQHPSSPGVSCSLSGYNGFRWR